MIVAYGEMDLDKLDKALIYRSQHVGDVTVVDRKYCPACNRTIAFVNMKDGLFATFNRAHLPCVRAHHEKTGQILPGFSVIQP